jgi:hypothetical protein
MVKQRIYIPCATDNWPMSVRPRPLLPTVNLLTFQDQLGYYSVGKLKFYSKLEALEVAKKLKQDVKWHFNDAAYSSYNWTQEPSETLEELYKARALQLREKYDYLVLWFSGGADSTNVLDTFLKNNIKLDEVVSFVNYSATGSKHDFVNGEVYQVAIPRIVEAQKLQPWLKHTIADIAQSQVDLFSSNDAKFDWTYNINGLWNPNNVARQYLKMSVPSWANMINSGKQVGFIYGVCKPRVFAVNNKYYWRFDDGQHGASRKTQDDNREWDFNELFYWSPDCAKIAIKQAHVVKNFLKHAALDSEAFTDKPHYPSCFVVSEDMHTAWQKHNKADNVKITFGEYSMWYSWNKATRKDLTHDALHKLIYPWWYPVPYQFKPNSLIFTDRDTWFFKLPDAEAARHTWRTGIEHMWNAVPDAYRQKDIANGIRVMTSKEYALEA